MVASCSFGVGFGVGRSLRQSDVAQGGGATIVAGLAARQMARRLLSRRAIRRGVE